MRSVEMLFAKSPGGYCRSDETTEAAKPPMVPTTFPMSPGTLT